MKRGEILAIFVILIGSALLYVGWANVGDLIPPYPLGQTGRSVVYIGDHLAFQYSDGGAPPGGALFIFSAVTLAGILNIVSGSYFVQDYR